MSKKSFILPVLVLVLVLFSSVLAQPTIYGGRRSFWSDLDPANHNWSSPNNWWTVDYYYIDENGDGGWDWDPLEPKWYEKVHPNMVPDMNIAAHIGKGELRADYPVELAALINDGFVMTDPTLDSGTFDVNWVDVGGGDSPAYTDPDPNFEHYLTVTGGTLNIGTPTYGDWYRYYYDWYWNFTGIEYGDMFGGQWVGPALRIGIVEWGDGTMYMTGGTVNVGGHVEVGAWGGTGELYMDGGTINITQGFYCPSAVYGAVGRVYLNGGTINAGYLNIHTMNSWWNQAMATGEIDFAGGVMKLDGRDEIEVVENYASGNALGATITAYGVPSGEIVVDGPETGKRAFLSIAYTADDKTTVHAATTDVLQAWSPTPRDGSGHIVGPLDDVVRPKLEWLPGDDAFSHDVYFGTDFNEVNDAIHTDPVCKGTLPTEDVNYVPDVDLKSLTTYYWRIDELKKPTILTKGQVWRFRTADFTKATHPRPHDHEINVFPTELTWTPGIFADTHDVYFSTDFNDVNDRLIDPCNTVTSVYPVSGLTFDTTYYWRVDEVNGLDMWPGHIWTFTITDHMHIDDMEEYTFNEDDNPIYYIEEGVGTWKDSWINNTGSEIKLENITVAWGSEKSMRFGYRNERVGGVYYSEAEADIADLEIAPNWNIGGTKAIVLHFYGESGNIADANSQMYFAVEDGDSDVAVITYPDVTALKNPEWQEWNIALHELTDQGVDVNDIAKVYLGFGDRTLGMPSGGETSDWSYVYFDDLEVRLRRCTGQASFPYGDLNGDCTVDNNDLAELSADWLVSDYNTIGFNGELWYFPLEGEPNYDMCWKLNGGRTGLPGDHALEFGYEHVREDVNEWPSENDDFVKVPPLNLFSKTMTVTAWVKRHDMQRDDSGIFYCDGVHDEPIWEGETVAGFNIGIGTDNSLGYMWPTAKGGTWQWDPSLSVLPNHEWAFCAMVVDDGDFGRIYMYRPEQDPELQEDTNWDAGHLESQWDIPATVGMHKWRNFDGVLDDLRVWRYGLTHENIQWLASDGDIGIEPNTPSIWLKFDDGTGLIAADSGCEDTAVSYHPNPSKANLYEDEPMYQRYVNFRDFTIFADNWLRDLTFPIE